MAIREGFQGPGERAALTGSVRVSRDRNTQLSVDCLIRGVEDGGPPPESLLVQITRFATVVAQKLADENTPLDRLEVRCLAITEPGSASGEAVRPASIEFDIRGVGPNVARTDLLRLAVETATERTRWHGPGQEVVVRVGSVEAAAMPDRRDLHPPNDAPTKTAVAASNEAPLAASPDVSTGRPGNRPRWIILVGAALAVLVAIVIGGQLLETVSPVQAPVSAPTPAPTVAPALAPTVAPALAPTVAPALAPTVAPTPAPNVAPTLASTVAPTLAPTVAPALAPTVAPALAPTDAPTLAPTVSPVVVAGVDTAPSPTVAPQPRPLLDVPFATRSQAGWPDDRDGVAWFAEDGYHLLARTPGQFVAIGATRGPSLSDVRVSLSYRKVAGPQGGGVGLILRDQEPDRRNGLNQDGRYYVLEVSDRGEVGIWRREIDTWVELVPWTRSGAVRPAADGNLIEASAVGQQLTLLVNGTQAASATDSGLAQGGVGVFLGGDGNEAVLERLAVQAPG
jgi:hypothetical protein